ncbi:FAD-dependent oxidoreductase [Tautonia plasticadhaerens]|uniref:FAD dependent oxidoreductase n=1 Tax=Tautonia plasticadhaerens TaxID=2527974 RepID=A0A518H361_9BACT|nr:FAD-dependent oxidoreductase [Tautonia plasticadhaerens]QDV35276.1 FAD dependent oxidoreductase [Tautonia plasticadhaerens]
MLRGRFAWATALLWLSPATGAEPIEAQVLVYGGTPSGIASALAAADSGRAVLLVEPYSHVGGMTTNGLSHPDFRTFEGLSGTYLAFTRRVLDHLSATFGAGSPEVAASFRGTHAGPGINRLVFERMIAERPGIEVRARTRLIGVEVDESGGSRRIAAARFGPEGDGPIDVRARVFIDASYEGDLMAAAGVPYRVGREGRAEYGEPLAPEEADGQVQGYNFRLTITDVPEDRVPPLEPPGYRREEFEGLVPLLESGALDSVFCPSRGGVYKAQIPPLPRGKRDINDVSREVVRLSLPGLNDAWPEGDAETRRAIFDAHVRHNVGMLYFLQTDPAVPARFREEARRWGFCRDEHPEHGHLPEQIYVREARRMAGRHVFTEHDTGHAPGDARSVPRPDAIACGDYGPNCHGTSHEGPRFGGRHSGEFYKQVPPYQIPFGVLLPRDGDCDNLLVPVACSASHVGFCALRLEPIWASMGQASGLAAHLAIRDGVPVGEVPVPELQRLLHAAESATIYVSDVPPGAPDFAAVQWWGTLGGLHGLAPVPGTPGQRGENIVGQYYEAFPNHAAGLDEPMDDGLRRRWLALASGLGLPTGPLLDAASRGEFIRGAFALAPDGP